MSIWSDKLIYGCLTNPFIFYSKAEIRFLNINIFTKKRKPRINQDIFIKKSFKRHQEKYDYSKVSYIDYNTHVIIICKKHGEFKQTPKLHLSGCGCPKCGKEKIKNPEISTILKNKITRLKNNGYETDQLTTDEISKIYKQLVKKTMNSIDKNLWIEREKKRQITNKIKYGVPTPIYLSENRATGTISKSETIWLNSLNVKIRNHVLWLTDEKWIIVDGFNELTNTVYEFYGDYYHGNPKIFKPEDYNYICKKNFWRIVSQNTRKRETNY